MQAVSSSKTAECCWTAGVLSQQALIRMKSRAGGPDTFTSLLCIGEDYNCPATLPGWGFRLNSFAMVRRLPMNSQPQSPTTLKISGSRGQKGGRRRGL